MLLVLVHSKPAELQLPVYRTQLVVAVAAVCWLHTLMVPTDWDSEPVLPFESDAVGAAATAG